MKKNANKIKEIRINNLLIFLFLFNSIIDTIIMQYETRTTIILLQYFSFITVLVYFLLFKKIFFNKVYHLLFIIMVYYFLLSFLSTDYKMTFNYLAKFLIPFPFFIVGYSAIDTNEKYLDFTKKSFYILAYFVLYIIYCSIFSIGNRFYAGIAGNLRTGYMGLQGLYIPTFLIIQGLFFNDYFRGKNKIIFNSLLVSSIIFFILIFKRTNILLLGMGIASWLIFERKIKVRKKIVLLLLIFLSLIFAFRTEEFANVFKVRESRFSAGYNVTQEGRYKENFFIWDKINDTPLTLLFGSGEVFNDIKTMSAEADFVGSRGRQTHNSYARLLWSGGIMGLFFFLLFYFKIWQKIRKSYRRNSVVSSNFKKILVIWALVFIALRLINDFSSGITYITFNAFFYTQLGSLLRVIGNHRIKEDINEQNHHI